MLKVPENEYVKETKEKIIGAIFKHESEPQQNKAIASAYTIQSFLNLIFNPFCNAS